MIILEVLNRTQAAITRLTNLVAVLAYDGARLHRLAKMRTNCVAGLVNT